MKISTHFHAAVSDWVRYILKIINSKFLRYHINDLIACGNVSAILIRYQLINFFLSYFIFILLANYITTGLQAFNVMSCYSYIHFINRKCRVGSITIFQRCFNGFYSLVYIEHHTMLHAIAVSSAKTEYLQLAKFIFSARNGCDFCCADV